MTLIQPAITWKPARDKTDRKGQPIVAIVIHATAGTDSTGWLSGNPNGTSIHVLIKKDGHCIQMVHDDYGANHVGFSKMVHNGVTYWKGGKYNCNHITLGIELENLNNGKDPYPEAQLRAAAWWVKHWQDVHGPLQLLMHRHIDQNGKTDARGIELTDITKYLDSSMNQEPQPIVAPNLDLTPDVPILSAPRATVEQAIAYLHSKKVDLSYTKADQALIANYYWLSAPAVGVDPLLAFAQMLHETGNLTSWWSLRPRRNPAGIGVTGEQSTAVRQPGIEWAGSSGKWSKGYSFASWDLAAKGHLGHLLVYALNDSQLNDAQRNIIKLDPRASAVPATSRGCITLRGLNGKWAVPGQNYADRIIAIANAIRGM